MFVYKDITGYSRSIIDLTLNVADAYSGFHVAIGAGTNAGGGLDYSGIMYSGYEGYIFDQSGDFVGGYAQGNPFIITSHLHDDNHVSYYINDVLIKNDYATLTTGSVNRIEFGKYGASTLQIDTKGESVNRA